MPKPEIKPELFPLTIDGKTEWVKLSQYAKQTAENQAIKLKADVKRSHVEEMVEAILNGVTEMKPEAPAEMVKTFDRVMSDFDEAVQHVKDLAAEAEEKKNAEEKAKKEKEEGEAKLVDAVKSKAVSLSDLSKLFDTGANMDRFVARKDVDNETLLGALKAGLGMSEFSNWMIGDLVVELEDRGQLGVVQKLAESMGKPYTNIYNAAKTCRNTPPEKRTPGVSYTIFAEIANGKYGDKPEEHKAKMSALIDKAAAGEISSSQEARKLKNEAAGKKPPVELLPEEDPKREFYVIDHKQELVQVTVGLPKELYAEGAIIIDKKTGKTLASLKAKPENRWVDLSIYKKPEAPAAAPAATGGKKPAANKKK